MSDVTLIEVGPRDGLQNEPREIPVAEKIALVDLLSQTGLSYIECASFVSPKWVPQMAGSGDVLQGIMRAKGVTYAALTPNMRGFSDALAAGADEVAIFASASEGFSKANINASIAESLLRFDAILEAAREAEIPVRGYVSCVVECPYDGPTAPSKVAEVTAQLLAKGCYEVSLGDTIGKGTPETVAEMLDTVLEIATPDHLAGHFHDTNGRALENIDVALAKGLRRFDTAVGGLGGCPYAPGASGNVATESVARHLQQSGHTHGLNLTLIDQAAQLARAMRGETHV